MDTSNKGKESRKDERFPVSLHTNVSNNDCITQDISASGVYIESNATFDLDEKIEFAIELESPGGKLILKCKGKVVRVEKRDGKVGVAVKIENSVMQSAAK